MTRPVPHSSTPIIGEIVAWRSWRVHDGHLCSVFMGNVWPWWHSLDDAPHMTGSIERKRGGVYAWKTRHQALAHAFFFPGGCVTGRVRLWGEVVEHERGYRAEYARIDSLYAFTGMSRAKYNRIAQRYAVPIDECRLPRLKVWTHFLMQPFFVVSIPAVWIATWAAVNLIGVLVHSCSDK